MASIQLASVAHYDGAYPLYTPFQVDLSVAVAAGTNRVAVLMVSSPASAVFASADWNAPTFNGATMTLLTRQSLGANVAHGVWYLAISNALPPGTYTLRVSSTTNHGGTSVYLTGLALQDVDATTPFGTVANYSNSGTPTSPVNTSITVGSGGLSLSMHGIYAPSAAGLALKAGASVLAAKATVAQREFIHAYEAAATQIGMTFTTSNQAAQLGIPVNDAVVAAPTISTQPSGQSVTSPTAATFTVVATSTGLTYQWQRNAVAISGANSASYTTPATSVSGGTANNGDTYRCVVTNSGGSVTSNSATLTVAPGPATATTLSGPTGGTVGSASAQFTVGANGTITGTITVTPSDGGGGGTFAATVGGGSTVTISSITPTATFTYTPGSVGAKTISIGDNGSLTDATPLTYNASLTAGTLTSSPLKNNTGSVLASVAFEAYVSNISTGALVVKKTSLTSNGSGVVSFTDGAVVASTSYRVVWRRTDTGAEGLETLTGT